MRITVDTGGTFTDILLEDNEGVISAFKVPTTPDNPSVGILNGLKKAAQSINISIEYLLSNLTTFTHATTYAINAILTKKTAKTAFLCTEGHRDTLLFREGGRIEIFNFTVEYPDPYVPRSLTFEIPERINYDGSISKNLDNKSLLKVINRLKKLNVEAVAVCLLWSTLNAEHEIKIEQFLQKNLPGIPISLSHKVNPILREYRRASSTCIDASLKPLMSKYLNNLNNALLKKGFAGNFFMVTSQGGVLDMKTSVESPIHLINSGPSMAPVGANFYLKKFKNTKNAIVTDLGGTTFDVSLVKDRKIPGTKETWIGQKYRGHMTGFPSVDVRSIGAGGGSIAWVDEGGLLHVGPQSSGSNPGPACYNRGGNQPTVTDAALVCGILNPDYFLGGDLKLSQTKAKKAINQIAKKLKLNTNETAIAILEVVTENMAQEIKNLTIHQGFNPVDSALISGGGASGINIVSLAKRLDCKLILIPNLGPVLSAAGAMVADITNEFSITLPMHTNNFSYSKVNNTIKILKTKCEKFIKNSKLKFLSKKIDYFIEAKYSDQVWEIEVPIKLDTESKITKASNIERDFHKKHKELFEIYDLNSNIEIIQWKARLTCKISKTKLISNKTFKKDLKKTSNLRYVFYKNIGLLKTKILKYEDIKVNKKFTGPVIIETPFMSVLIDPNVNCSLNHHNCLELNIPHNKKEIIIDESATSLW